MQRIREQSDLPWSRVNVFSVNGWIYLCVPLIGSCQGCELGEDERGDLHQRAVHQDHRHACETAQSQRNNERVTDASHSFISLLAVDSPPISSSLPIFPPPSLPSSQLSTFLTQHTKLCFSLTPEL